jgi:heme/copper-type cytochrome/quinol oxidase subunit 2
MDGTTGFFQALAPILVANILTVLAVYCAWAYTQAEKRNDVGGSTLIFWAVFPVLLALYGMFSWGVYPFKKTVPPSALHTHQAVPSSLEQLPADAGSEQAVGMPLDR